MIDLNEGHVPCSGRKEHIVVLPGTVSVGFEPGEKIRMAPGQYAVFEETDGGRLFEIFSESQGWLASFLVFDAEPHVIRHPVMDPGKVSLFLVAGGMPLREPVCSGGRDDRCASCGGYYSGCGDGWDGRCPQCADAGFEEDEDDE